MRGFIPRLSMKQTELQHSTPEIAGRGGSGGHYDCEPSGYAKGHRIFQGFNDVGHVGSINDDYNHGIFLDAYESSKDERLRLYDTWWI